MSKLNAVLRFFRREDHPPTKADEAEAETLKIPYMAIIGKREAESDALALRVRGAGKKQEVMPVEDFIARVQDELATRALTP